MSAVAAPVAPLPPAGGGPAEPGAIEPAAAAPSRAGHEPADFAEVLAGAEASAVNAAPGEPGREDPAQEDADRDGAPPEDSPALLAAVAAVVLPPPPAIAAGTPPTPTTDGAEAPLPMSAAAPGDAASPSPVVPLPAPASGRAEGTSSGVIDETPVEPAPAGGNASQAPDAPAAGSATPPGSGADTPPSPTNAEFLAGREAGPGPNAEGGDAALLRAAAGLEVETDGSAPGAGIEARDPALSPRAALDMGPASAAAPSDRHGDLGDETDPGDRGSGSGGGSALDAAAISAPSRPVQAADARTEASEGIGTRPPVEQVAEHVTLVVRAGRQAMRFRLDPPDLGHVAIDAVLDGRTLSLRIVTEQESVRDALERSLPRLREALAQQGLDAGQVTIQLGVDSGGRRAAPEAAPLPPLPAAARPARPAAPTPSPARAEPAGLLDLWA